MINANELRIGNWVKIGHHQTTVFHIIGDEDFFEPIPLTPEILEKCGFKEMPSKGFNKVVRVRLKTIELSVFLNGNIYLERQGEDILLPLKYTHLHQLQNLYFALTGEELNYTP
jgi:hypothetical protein